MSDKTESAPVSDKKPRAKFRALVGMNYGDKRVEAGQVVDDIPEDSVEWLLQDRVIEKVR
jgi:hypothetical protein